MRKFTKLTILALGLVFLTGVILAAQEIAPAKERPGYLVLVVQNPSVRVADLEIAPEIVARNVNFEVGVSQDLFFAREVKDYAPARSIVLLREVKRVAHGVTCEPRHVEFRAYPPDSANLEYQEVMVKLRRGKEIIIVPARLGEGEYDQTVKGIIFPLQLEDSSKAASVIERLLSPCRQ